MHKTIVIALALILAACGGRESATGKAATPGDKAALQRLADAYNKIDAGQPGRPLNMSMKDRKAFVEEVFRTAGYDYDATLHALAQARPGDADIKDLAELALMAHRSSGTSERMEDVYTAQELADVRAIESKLH